MTARSCRICSHPERTVINMLLLAPLAPRAINKRFGTTTRRSLIRHRDLCLKTPEQKENEQ